MTNRAVHLFTRCNAGTSKGTVGRSTNPDTLKPSDIAAGLAGLPEGETAALMAKHMHDPQAYRKLRAKLLSRAAKLAVDQKWKGYTAEEKRANPQHRQPVKLGTLADLAMDELLRASVCPSCRGSTRSENNKRACQRCGGTGRLNYSASQRARRVGVHVSNWQRTWSRRYEDIYTTAREYERRGLRHIVRKIGR